MNIFKPKGTMRVSASPDVKTYYENTIMKPVWCWYNNRQPETNSSLCMMCEQVPYYFNYYSFSILKNLVVSPRTVFRSYKNCIKKQKLLLTVWIMLLWIRFHPETRPHRSRCHKGYPHIPTILTCLAKKKHKTKTHSGHGGGVRDCWDFFLNTYFSIV